MPEYVRVKHKSNGSESSILRHMYDFAPEEYDLLNKAAVSTGGQPIPAKPKTTTVKAVEKKTAATRPANSATQDAADPADNSGHQADTEKENGR